MATFYGIVCISGIILTGLVVYLANKRSPTKTTTPYSEPQAEELLPNGFRRRDYHEMGIPDDAIDLWGLDQSSAPDPYVAGFVIADMADGEFDGKIDL